jgi:hypothetical protein
MKAFSTKHQAITPPRWANRPLAWTFGIGLLLLVAGCATEVGQHTLLKQGYAPKPANYSIEVFTNGLPSRVYERVAILDAHCESQGWMTPNLEHDALPMLIKQARAAGCDAIIEIEARKSDNWTLETRTLHFSAVGIAYK